MPIYLASDRATQRLVDFPESGMGFQVFRFRQSHLVAFNATIVIPLAELREPGAYSDLERFLANDEEERLMPREMLDLDGDISLAFSQLDPGIRDPSVGLTSPDAVSG
jgi:hypothetical protein